MLLDMGTGPSPWGNWIERWDYFFGDMGDEGDNEEDDEQGDEDESIGHSNTAPAEDQERADSDAYQKLMEVLVRR
jgi:hypothetical protein